MSQSTNLGLPFLEAGQAQKHVTLNEALRLLDTLVQLAVLDRDLTAPPSSPSEGQRWIVKTSPTGAWSGHGNHVAAWQDGTWQFSAPKTGFLAYVVDEGALLYWDGDSWEAVQLATALQNLSLLGIGTIADATNPVSAKLNNALWAAKTVTEGGDGNLRYKLSKESGAKTLSFLFQDNYSGRAEIGLTGDDDFHFKVSADGSTWFEGIKIDRASGRISFPVSGGPRDTLSANRTYYVRTDGSDANSGLANTAGGAFLTIQKAVDVIAALDCSIYQVTVQVADGTYTGAVVLRKYVGALAPIIQGNNATPANVLINVTAATAFYNDNGSLWQVNDLKIQTTGLACFHAINFGAIQFQNVNFGAGGSLHLYAQALGVIKATGNYAVSGSTGCHAASNGWVILSGRTITYSNTPNFSDVNFRGGRGGVLECYGMTFTNGGTVTGKRYNAVHNGVIFTNGAGSTYVPGDVAGDAPSGLYA